MSFENVTRDELIEQIVNLQTEKEQTKRKVKSLFNVLNCRVDSAAEVQQLAQAEDRDDYFKGFWDGLYIGREDSCEALGRVVKEIENDSQE